MRRYYYKNETFNKIVLLLMLFFLFFSLFFLILTFFNLQQFGYIKIVLSFVLFLGMSLLAFIANYSVINKKLENNEIIKNGIKIEGEVIDFNYEIVRLIDIYSDNLAPSYKEEVRLVISYSLPEDKDKSYEYITEPINFNVLKLIDRKCTLYLYNGRFYAGNFKIGSKVNGIFKDSDTSVIEMKKKYNDTPLKWIKLGYAIFFILLFLYIFMGWIVPNLS